MRLLRILPNTAVLATLLMGCPTPDTNGTDAGAAGNSTSSSSGGSVSTSGGGSSTSAPPSSGNASGSSRNSSGNASTAGGSSSAASAMSGGSSLPASTSSSSAMGGSSSAGTLSSSGTAGASSGTSTVLPPAMCERINLAESPEALNGSCGFAPYAANMPQPYQLGHRVSVNNALYTQGTFGTGSVAAGCGECLEVTSATGSTVVIIADTCTGSGTAACDGAGTGMVASQTVSTNLAVAGWDMASVRGVPCPVVGNVHLVVDAVSQPPAFLRLRLYNHAVGIQALEVRGAGAGVSANNPWVPLTRSLGNAWDHTGDARNGGTAWQVRITTGQGDVVEVPQDLTFVDDLDVDLGFQTQDHRDMGGAACVWEPTRDVYREGFAQEGEVRWALASGTANEVNTSCHSGTSCLQLPFTGAGVVLFQYNNDIPAALVPKVDLYGRVGSISSNVLRVRLMGVGATCTDVALPTVSIAWTHVSLDMGGSCPPGTLVNGIQITNVSGNGSLFLDDVTLPPS